MKLLTSIPRSWARVYIVARDSNVKSPSAPPPSAVPLPPRAENLFVPLAGKIIKVHLSFPGPGITLSLKNIALFRSRVRSGTVDEAPVGACEGTGPRPRLRSSRANRIFIFTRQSLSAKVGKITSSSCRNEK